MPNFSILTPVRNSEMFITRCLESVKNQDLDMEHLIQDAKSSDSTMRIINDFSNLNMHVKSVSETDDGQSDALNKLLDRATGKYIGWLNSDETYLPGTLRKVHEIFERTNADVVYGDCFFVDENLNRIRLYSNHKFNRIILRHLGCYIPSCSTFFRAESLANFSFDVRFKRCMDWDMYLQIDNLRFEYLKEALSTFAIHSNQVTNKPESEDYHEFSLLQEKHGLNRNPALRKPKLKLKLFRIFLKMSNGNYLRELYYLIPAWFKS